MAKAKPVRRLSEIVPAVYQVILNISLSLLAIVLSVMLIIELVEFIQLIFLEELRDYKYFLSNILVFFLYFEFITMIVKYFKEDYHFPLRYFMYIGITAMIRLIIVDHDNAMDTLIYSFVILVMLIGYYIINITPRERPIRKVNATKEKQI